jgi:Icc-related predicted phosphoesterase
LEGIESQADVLLIAGDLTRIGEPDEARVLAREIAGLGLPIVAVLGNHDFHRGRQAEVRAEMEKVGVAMLEGTAMVVDTAGGRLGIAGTKGFGGGFPGACGSDFGEPEMKAFVAATKSSAAALEASLRTLEADLRVALLHYAPVEETLQGERLEIYPFLGSYLLAEAVDRAGADLVLHGHAHGGNERGATPCGIRVRNVAQPVLHRAYAVYCFNGDCAGDEL